MDLRELLEELPVSVRRKCIGAVLIVAALGWFLAAYYAGRQEQAGPTPSVPEAR